MTDLQEELKCGKENIYSSGLIPCNGSSFEDNGLLVYWNCCKDAQTGEVLNGITLLETRKVRFNEKEVRIGKWAYTTAKTPKEYAVILRGTDAFQKYQLMWLANERKDTGLAKQVLGILRENGMREVLIEATTNPDIERADREDSCDYRYGFGKYKDECKDERISDKSIRENSLIGKLEKLAR